MLSPDAPHPSPGSIADARSAPVSLRQRLREVLPMRGHVILIDDARCFGQGD